MDAAMRNVTLNALGTSFGNHRHIDGLPEIVARSADEAANNRGSGR
jgi:hypothetical protein